MEFKICPQKPKFLLAIQQPAQLRTWLDQHRDIIGLCMVGRSNVGKSSLINALFGQGTARTSKTPGRTREIIIFEFQLPQEEGQPPHPPLYLFDLPGYGHAEVSKQMADNWNELITLFFSFLPPQVLLLNIQDGRHPYMPADRQFQSFIRTYAVESYLAFNKLDKLKTQKERSALEKLKKEIFAKAKHFKQIYFVSAEKGNGLEELKNGLKNFLLKKIQFQLSPPQDKESN